METASSIRDGYKNARLSVAAVDAARNYRDRYYGVTDQIRLALRDESFTPGHEAIVGLAMMSNDEFERAFPTAIGESTLRAQYARDPRQYVPTREVIRDILLLGHNSVEQLKQYTLDRVDALTRAFPPLTVNGQEIDNTFSPASVQYALELAEILFRGMKRNTGEDTIAHVLRMMNDGLDLIGQNLAFRKRHPGYLTFVANTAEMFLLGIVLHDFTEGPVEIVNSVDPTKREVRRGFIPAAGYQVNNDGSGGSVIQTGITTKAEVLVQNSWIPVPDSESTFTSTISCKMDGSLAALLAQHLEGLNTSSIKEGQEVARLNQEYKTIQHNGSLYFVTSMIEHKIAYVVRFFDRKDNCRSRSFMWDLQKKTYIPSEIDGLVKKMEDTYNEYDPIERQYAWIMTNLSPYSLQTVLELATKYKTRYIDGYNDYNVARNLPTLWSRLLKLGFTPDQAYKMTKPRPNNIKYMLG